MGETVFQRVVVPVANEDDATATTAALRPHVSGSDSTVISVHVIEKAGGAPDKASVEQREQQAAEILATVTDGFDGAEVSVKTDLRFHTDIAESIIDSAHEWDASAIVFTPRGGSRWRKLLTGDVTHKLVGNSDIPILVLPDREVAEDE